jgi:hypothetical protein
MGKAMDVSENKEIKNPDKNSISHCFDFNVMNQMPEFKLI